MTYFSPADRPLPTPNRSWAPQDVYDAAHLYFPIVYNDVALRNMATGEFFFPTRAIEPERGSIWFIGGRAAMGRDLQHGAAEHVERDTKLLIAPGRFLEVSHFGISHVTEQPGGEVRGRHAGNTVLVANLTEEEVEKLNITVASGGLSAEYTGAGWYDPVTDRSRLSPPVQQFLRDYFDHTVMMNALHQSANEENIARSGSN